MKLASVTFRVITLAIPAMLLSGCFGSSGSVHDIGGTVTGLSDDSVALRLQVSSKHDEVTIDDNGPFSFNLAAAPGNSYEISVAQQPGKEVCEVHNARGSVSASTVNEIEVQCAPFRLDAIPDFGQVTLEWAFKGPVNIRYSSDRDCDWDNYSTCADGEMLLNVQSGLTLDRSDGLVPGRDYFFVMEVGGLRTQQVAATAWVPSVDGDVNASLVHEGRWYVGGDFTHAGPRTGGGAMVSAEDGRLRGVLQHVHGRVRAIVPDDRGGWFIGGSIRNVDGEYRARLARIRADGSLDPDWSIGRMYSTRTIRGDVWALAYVDGILYVGGSFDLVMGETRRRLMALDGETGEILDWLPEEVSDPDGNPARPGARNAVYALTVVDGVVYIGGRFSEVNGHPRDRLAALDAGTGELLAWNPGANDSVESLLHVDGRLYAAGMFTEAGGQSRERLAAFDLASGDLLAWNPQVDDRVMHLAHDDGRLYAGGRFGHVGSETRQGLAAFDLPAGTLSDWYPDIHTVWEPYSTSLLVTSLAAADGKVYSGWFSAERGDTYKSKSSLFAFDADANLLDWSPRSSDGASALAVSDNRIYIGGNSRRSRMNVTERASLAAFDVATGALSDWNPAVNDTVQTMALHDGRIYTGGAFTEAGGETRSRLAAFDVATGVLSDWNPVGVGDGYIETLTVANDTIYVGGDFSQAGDVARERLAAFDTGDGALVDWNPGANDVVDALAYAGQQLYVGGRFTELEGQTRHRLAAFDTATGALTDWSPELNNRVFALTHGQGKLYAGGYFREVDGAKRERLAAFDLETGELDLWSAGVSASASIWIESLVYANNTVYAGGSFTYAGNLGCRQGIWGVPVCGVLAGAERDNLAAFDAETGQLSAWDPEMDDVRVRTLVKDSGNLFVGGIYTPLGVERHSELLIYPVGDGF